MNQYFDMLIVIIILLIIGIFNSIKNLMRRSQNCWEQILETLDERSDFISSLAYEIEPENTKILDISEIKEIKSIEERKQKEKILNSELDNIYKKIEEEDELKNNEKVIKLIQDIKDVEVKIDNYGEFYNELTNRYNKKIKIFPASIVFNMFNFKQRDKFTI